MIDAVVNHGGDLAHDDVAVDCQQHQVTRRCRISQSMGWNDVIIEHILSDSVEDFDVADQQPNDLNGHETSQVLQV